MYKKNSLIFKNKKGTLSTLLSERRDLNPRPPEPHSGTLPGCATFRYVRYDLIFSRTLFISSKSFLRDGFSFLLCDLFAPLSISLNSISS